MEENREPAELVEQVKKLFDYYKQLGEKSFTQVTDEKLFWQYNSDSNSMAILVQHLWGNMLSRWTDFLNSDGEKEWRKRDEEFEPVITSREELMQRWSEGWNCLFAALNEIQPADLNRMVYIRNQGHTVADAIFRQLAHYSYHVGQIVFLGKMLAEEKWETLSIAKGKSNSYNAEKFSEPKHTEHFTDGVK